MDYRDFIQKKRNTREDLAQLFDTQVWNDLSRVGQLPAELASLRVIQRFCEVRETPEPFNKNDHVILVHADNPDAEYCATVILRTLKEHKLLGDVVIDDPWKVEGLDPSQPQRFQKAVEGVWKDMGQRFPPEGKTKYYLNLTGGYKVIILLFACLAYVKGAADTSIFYLNEEAGSEVLVMGFDAGHPIKDRFSSITTGYIDPSGVGKGPSAVFKAL